MKKVITIIETWCDAPGCAESVKEEGGQETTTAEFWFYVPGKGRKPNPIRVELCDDHREEMRSLFLSMQKYDQKDD